MKNFFSKIFNPKTLFYSIFVFLVIAFASLIAGIVFFVLYFKNSSNCNCDSISKIDVAIFLITFGLGVISICFCIVQIRGHETELIKNDIRAILDTYHQLITLTKQDDFKDVMSVCVHLSDGFEEKFESFFTLFKNGNNDPEKFFSYWDIIRESVFVKKINNISNKIIAKYDSNDDTLESMAFKALFKKLIQELEEISARCVNMDSKNDDTIFNDYILPELISVFRRFLPYIYNYEFEKEIQYFTTIVFQYAPIQLEEQKK